jgi:hypothetical protein
LLLLWRFNNVYWRSPSYNLVRIGMAVGIALVRRHVRMAHDCSTGQLLKLPEQDIAFHSLPASAVHCQLLTNQGFVALQLCQQRWASC